MSGHNPAHKVFSSVSSCLGWGAKGPTERFYFYFFMDFIFFNSAKKIGFFRARKNPWIHVGGVFKDEKIHSLPPGRTKLLAFLEMLLTLWPE